MRESTISPLFSHNSLLDRFHTHQLLSLPHLFHTHQLLSLSHFSHPPGALGLTTEEVKQAVRDTPRGKPHQELVVQRLQQTHGEAAAAQEERLAGLTQAQVKLVKELLKRSAASAGTIFSAGDAFCTSRECNDIPASQLQACLSPLLLL